MAPLRTLSLLSDIYVVPSPSDATETQHKTAAIVLRHLKALDSIIFNTKLLDFLLTFPFSVLPPHSTAADVIESH